MADDAQAAVEHFDRLLDGVCGQFKPEASGASTRCVKCGFAQDGHRMKAVLAALAQARQENDRLGKVLLSSNPVDWLSEATAAQRERDVQVCKDIAAGARLVAETLDGRAARDADCRATAAEECAEAIERGD